MREKVDGLGMIESIREIAQRVKLEGVMSEKEFFEAEIALWKGSGTRKSMVEGERYFRGEHDILKVERHAIGRDGRLKRIDNLPNNRIVDNQYQRLVNQKVNYLMGKEFVFDGECGDYIEILNNVLGGEFKRILKCTMRDAINMGISWVYVYTDEDGKLKFRRIPGYEVIAYWKDSEHTILDRAVRLFTVEGYKGKQEYVREMAEIYSDDRVCVYEIVNGHLVKEEEHFYQEEGKIPLIAFKYNEKEIPLIKRVKSLQDMLNKTISDYANSLEQDVGNSILVLKNYDGTDLGEFRHNLASFGAVKVRSVDGAEGDVKVLNTQLDSNSFTQMVNLLKNAMVENAMGYDSKSDKIGNNPNQLVMKSMFSDLDLDVNEIEVEFKYSFGRLKEFIDEYLKNYGYGYFSEEKVEIVFNRDTLINETEAIENCAKSLEILSEETVTMQHPWVNDVKREIERKELEKNGA